MLDYQIARKGPFDATGLFTHGIDKLMKLKRYQRKKKFKFSDLLKFMKENEMNEVERKKQEADELLQSIRPLL